MLARSLSLSYTDAQANRIGDPCINQWYGIECAATPSYSTVTSMYVCSSNHRESEQCSLIDRGCQHSVLPRNNLEGGLPSTLNYLNDLKQLYEALLQ